MEGLFFVVDPAWWINPIQTSSLVIALVGGCILGFYLWHIGKKETIKGEIKTERYQFHPIHTVDPQYAKKTLDEIRKYLSYRYDPNHSWAHILNDIRSYSTDSGLIRIIEQLETIEYSQQHIEKNNFDTINAELIEKLQI